MSFREKKFAPLRTGSPAAKVLFDSWISASVPAPVRRLPWAMKNPAQHAPVPTPAVVVSTRVPLDAANSGPARASVVGSEDELERRRLSTEPLRSSVAASNDSSGALPTDTTFELSPMNMNETPGLRLADVMRVPRTSRRPPASSTTLGSPFPVVVGCPGVVNELREWTAMKLLAGEAIEPPVNEANGAVVVLRMTDPSAMLNPTWSWTLNSALAAERYGPLRNRKDPSRSACENMRSSDPPWTEPTGAPTKLPPENVTRGFGVELKTRAPSPIRTRFPSDWIVVLVAERRPPASETIAPVPALDGSPVPTVTALNTWSPVLTELSVRLMR